MPNIATVLDEQRHYYKSNETRSYCFRTKQLKQLKQMLRTNESQIYKALKQDLNKSKHETLTTELGLLYMEIDFVLKHLKQWMQPKRVKTPVTHKGSKNYIYQEPYGVALIIAPWNYPLQLSLAPMIGAMAAGNCVVLKPSEYAKATSQLLAHIVAKTFPSYYITVVEGGKNVSQALLAKPFDYIFFTGSTKVGKIVMEAASQFLTPVTLELGGKSPVIVDHDANIQLAAKRIAWGKFTNAGQTCVAPDFVYVHEQVKKKFIKHIHKYVKQFYGKKPLNNTSYVKIINHKHFQRLHAFLKNGTITFGGGVDEESLKIEPTLIEGITWDDPVMQDEIFGPILPVLPFSSLGEIIEPLRTINSPLALYYFGKSDRAFTYINKHIPFGGGCINDTLYHLANPHLPFGGVGASGMGSYHGIYSFKTFSHEKAILKQTNAIDFPFRYPGKKWTHKLVKKIMK